MQHAKYALPDASVGIKLLRTLVTASSFKYLSAIEAQRLKIKQSAFLLNNIQQFLGAFSLREALRHEVSFHLHLSLHFRRGMNIQ